jgi:hypothetical protein
MDFSGWIPPEIKAFLFVLLVAGAWVGYDIWHFVAAHLSVNWR